MPAATHCSRLSHLAARKFRVTTTARVYICVQVGGDKRWRPPEKRAAVAQVARLKRRAWRLASIETSATSRQSLRSLARLKIQFRARARAFSLRHTHLCSYATFARAHSRRQLCNSIYASLFFFIAATQIIAYHPPAPPPPQLTKQ